MAFTRRTGSGFLRLPHARRLEEEIAEAIADMSAGDPMTTEPTADELEVRCPGVGLQAWSCGARSRIMCPVCYRSQDDWLWSHEGSWPTTPEHDRRTEH